jgi:hypothetical protein
MSPDEAKEWLRRSQICVQVSIVWINLREGITIQFHHFVQFYDDLWFPSSDDLLIVSKDGPLAFAFSHEEVLTRHEASRTLLHKTQQQSYYYPFNKIPKPLPY